MSSVGHNFSKQLAKYNISKCPAFCKKSEYNVGLQSFDRLSFINIDDKAYDVSAAKKEPTRAIFMYYSSTDITVSTTSKLISLSSFISSIGGNLGLFVGFSFLSVFFFIHNFFIRIHNIRKQEKPTLSKLII